ncbi:hypothetical protein EV44_g5308 [Erysiphe necator]|uniref:Uncharacterized protein n=1 Tax=Uncinula necator TaxID=52586 RepID=A0A0B1PBM2_UNCNE|nr:hypothetical protein EV44_g5308 [Erysiphe necator]
MSSFSEILQSLMSFGLPENRTRQNEESKFQDNRGDDNPSKNRNISFHPVIKDVLAVKDSLIKKLPIEIIDNIIDFAEYWPHTHVSVRQNSAIDSHRITAGINEDEFLLRSYPLGYIPKENDPTDLSFQTHSFATNPPTPGYECANSSPECTRRNLIYWAEESKMRGEFPCRKIVFTLQSHDQGWGGIDGCKGTYSNSFTWFDVGKEEACMFEKPRKLSPGQPGDSNTQGLEIDSGTILQPYFVVSPLTFRNESLENIDVICSSRTISPQTDSCITTSRLPRTDQTNISKFNHPLLPDSNVLQKNVAAEINTKKHVITWSYDDNIDPESAAGDNLENMGRGRATSNGEYVRSLKIGQIVTVWGKSRFRNWINHVEEVMIDIYWAV